MSSQPNLLGYAPNYIRVSGHIYVLVPLLQIFLAQGKTVYVTGLSIYFYIGEKILIFSPSAIFVLCERVEKIQHLAYPCGPSCVFLCLIFQDWLNAFLIVC